MIQIDDKLISEDLFSEEFVCNLNKCKGICCVEAMVPHSDADEVEVLKEIYLKIKPYLCPEAYPSHWKTRNPHSRFWRWFSNATRVLMLNVPMLFLMKKALQNVQ